MSKYPEYGARNLSGPYVQFFNKNGAKIESFFERIGQVPDFYRDLQVGYTRTLT